jgi:hypothetical protein
MKPLSALTREQLEQRIADLEYALSGLAQMGGGEIPEEDRRELEGLRAELKRRAGAARRTPGR